MDVRSYFESLGLELASLQKRVRYLINDAHWPTDGEWKESVLRQVLRRHLPAAAVVGRGFVITKDAVSSQIDVLISDGTKPVVFRDGDLAFVTPDAVLGIIEVKSRVNAAQFGDAAAKIARNIELVRVHPNIRAFAALFSFEAEGYDATCYLERAVVAASNCNQRLDFSAVGDEHFLKYWHLDPESGQLLYQTWCSYLMPHLASGYFVHNVVDAVCPDSVVPNNEVWFPERGKEQFKDGDQAAQWAG